MQGQFKYKNNQFFHKVTHWDFDWNCLESTGQIGRNRPPDNIESFYPKTWTIHLFSFSLISLIRVLQFSKHKSYTYIYRERE